MSPSIRGFAPRGTAARKAKIENLQRQIKGLRDGESLDDIPNDLRERMTEARGDCELELERLENEQRAAELQFKRDAVDDAVPDYMAPFEPSPTAKDAVRQTYKPSKASYAAENDSIEEEEDGAGIGGRAIAGGHDDYEHPPLLPTALSPYRQPDPGAPDPARNLIFEKITEERDRLLGEATSYRKEIAVLRQQLADATIQRQRGLMLEALGNYFSNKNWIPASVVSAAAADNSLADQILALSRERENIANARADADRVPISGADDLAKKTLVQVVWPEHKGWTILMPLRYSLAAVKAAIDVWSQEHMERMEDLKEKTK